MKNTINSAIFLVTGLITAAGSNPQHSKLKLARSLVEEEQYIAAIYTAEKIIEHYPNTSYADSAKDLINVIRANYLSHHSQ